MSERNLATGFQQVAGKEENEENSKNEIDSNINSNKDVISDVLAKKPKSKTHEFRGYYLEWEVIKAIDTIAKDRAGTKSEIVNDVLKFYFKEHGYMK